MTRTQNFLLIFLCGLVLLTLLAVLWANLQNPEIGTALAWFARWGAGVVIAEIIGLFVFVAKGVMAGNGQRDVSLFVYPDPRWEALGPVWDRNSCRITGNKGNLSVTPVEHGGSGTLEIPLSAEECKSLDDRKTLVVSVKDNKGIEWSSSFHLSRLQTRIVPDEEEQKVLSLYGPDDE